MPAPRTAATLPPAARSLRCPAGRVAMTGTAVRAGTPATPTATAPEPPSRPARNATTETAALSPTPATERAGAPGFHRRSEERRVGKEGRSGRAPAHEKRK